MKKFAPPPTRFGAPALQAKDAATPVRHAPPPTRYGAPTTQLKAVPPRPAQPPQPGRPRPGLPVQRFGYVTGALGWLSDRLFNFGALAEGAAEGMAEGMEYIDDYLMTQNRQDLHFNLHGGRQFRDEWARFQGGDRTGIFCFQDDPIGFRNRVRSGEGFIWVVTAQKRLVIGNSGQTVNHAMLAEGHPVIAAGEGGARPTPGELAWQEWASNDRQWRADDACGKHYPREQEPARPLIRCSDTVELDYQSGHYRPRTGWLGAVEAWAKTGFNPVQRTNTFWPVHL